MVAGAIPQGNVEILWFMVLDLARATLTPHLIRGKADMAAIQVQFRLKFATRHDERASVYVGYCPALGLYSQGTTESEAGEAVVNAAKLFIVTCYERDILHTVLRGRGMTKAVADVKELLEKNEEEFTAVHPHRFDKEFFRDVPINLIAAKESGKACQN